MEVSKTELGLCVYRLLLDVCRSVSRKLKNCLTWQHIAMVM